MSNLKNTNTNN